MLRKLLDESGAYNGDGNFSFDFEAECAPSSPPDADDVDPGYFDALFDGKAKHTFSVFDVHDDIEPKNIGITINHETQDTSVRLGEKAIIFCERELNLMRRARNHHTDSQPKNVDIRDYHLATAFEALIGWLWITNQKSRVYHIIDRALAIADALMDETQATK